MRNLCPLTSFLFIVFFSSGNGNSQENPRNWDKDPVLQSVALLTRDVMNEYQNWANDWVAGGRRSTEVDMAMNRMAECVFVRLIHVLAAAPNPRFAAHCVRFLHANVPSEFDEVWRFVFIEFSNVAVHIDGKEDGENLLKRSMRKSPD